jgi:hypothetical protein
LLLLSATILDRFTASNLSLLVALDLVHPLQSYLTAACLQRACAFAQPPLYIMRHYQRRPE